MTAVNYQARIEKLLARAQADVVALIPGANFVYFTGLHYHRSERPTLALIHRGGLTLVLPKLEVSKWEQRPDLSHAQVFAWGDTEGYMGAFRQAVSALKLDTARLGVDGMSMRVFEWLALSAAGASIGNALDEGQTLLGIRAIKSADEVEAIRRAIHLSETALRHTLEQVQVGMSETQIARILQSQLNDAGSEANAFDPIVLTGEKSALPHGNTGERVLQTGEFLLLDFGGMKDEYPADITRTFAYGAPSDEMRRMYDAVYAANAAARAIAAPGVPCGEVDRAAREAIIKAGYGEYFTHRTGHGLGLEGHELPQIASKVEAVLEEGMVFTIEPGVYLAHIGGVRIEDDMVVTATGSESLTSYPRELEVR